MTDWVGTFSIVGTLVLIAILIQQSYATWEERRDKRMEKEKEDRERPQFILSDKLAFDPETVTIVKEKAGMKTWHMRVLKAIVVNKGELMARNAKTYVAYGNTLRGWSSVWTTHSSWDVDDIVLPAPDFIEDTADAVHEFLNVEFFGKEFWTNHIVRDIVGGSTHPVVILYTIEGSEFAYSTNPNIKPMKLPLDVFPIFVSVGMENAKQSEIMIPKFRLSAWDKLELV